MHNNPHIQYLLDKGYSLRETETSFFIERTFPCEIHGRVFDSEEEYQQELHDFLNGQ